MRHRIGGVHRSRLLCLLAFLFSFFLVGFAKPRDPRVTAIVVPDLGGETIESAAKKELTRTDGVVLYVSLAEHEMRIETGPAARRLLPDDAAKRIMDERMRPLLREDRTDEAVDAGVAAIEDALRASPARPAGTSRWSTEETIAGVVVAALIVVLLGAVALSGSRRGARRAGTTSNHVVHVPYVDAGSSGGGFSGGGGATSSW